MKTFLDFCELRSLENSRNRSGMDFINILLLVITSVVRHGNFVQPWMKGVGAEKWLYESNF